jgi:hypothetical protein
MNIEYSSKLGYPKTRQVSLSKRTDFLVNYQFGSTFNLDQPMKCSSFNGIGKLHAADGRNPAPVCRWFIPL